MTYPKRARIIPSSFVKNGKGQIIKFPKTPDSGRCETQPDEQGESFRPKFLQESPVLTFGNKVFDEIDTGRKALAKLFR